MGKRSPEKQAEYSHWYAQTENGKAARLRAQRKYHETAKWREAHRKGVATYRARSKIRSAAHYALTDAIRRGKLVPAKACETCGASGSTQGHHRNGYDKPHQLDVAWLCLTCHRIEHTLGRPKKVSPLGLDTL